MGLTIADTYYLKAKAAIGDFWGDWDEASESLNYALSYDENHCAALCLLGEIYARNLNQYTEAFECFDKVIAINSNFIAVYPKYANCLIWANEIERAFKLINFALTIKGVDKALLYCISAYGLEVSMNYKVAIKFLKEAKKHTYNDDYFSFIEDEEKRIKKKLKLGKSKVKKKKPSSKKKKKNNKK